jgi:hypothetical protein
VTPLNQRHEVPNTLVVIRRDLARRHLAGSSSTNAMYPSGTFSKTAVNSNCIASLEYSFVVLTSNSRQQRPAASSDICSSQVWYGTTREAGGR